MLTAHPLVLYLLLMYHKVKILTVEKTLHYKIKVLQDEYVNTIN